MSRTGDPILSPAADSRINPCRKNSLSGRDNGTGRSRGFDIGRCERNMPIAAAAFLLEWLESMRLSEQCTRTKNNAGSIAACVCWFLR